jgi:hypothetical protein
MTSQPDKSKALADYLRLQAALPFVLGKSDCCCFIADWVREQRGVDPMAYCRGGYADERGAGALLSGYGGLPRAVGRALRRSGAAMTRDPQPGDIAVVAVNDVAACAIRTERRWALRLDDGMALLPLDRVRVIAAWSI